jgi:hypothetical protein
MTSNKKFCTLMHGMILERSGKEKEAQKEPKVRRSRTPSSIPLPEASLSPLIKTLRSKFYPRFAIVARIRLWRYRRRV